jgi:Glycosyl transferases group 1
LARATDDRIWFPDLNAVIDWQAVWNAGEVRHGGLATFWTQATAGVNYYRADLPARHLPGKTVRFESRDIQPLDGEVEDAVHFPRQEGAAVWMFPGNTTRALAMTEMHLQGMRVLVEVDDNYTVAPPLPQLSTWLTTRDKSGADQHSYEIHRRIVQSKACHGVIVSTPKLAEVYSQLHKNVYVCPNSVDPDDWDDDPPHQADGVLRIGWAGSASHAYDLAEIRPALDWASRQKDVEVVILGQLELSIEHRQIPWTDSLAEYRQNVQALDVILCPLRSNQWADCKSDVKSLEGAMAGALPVVSRTEPYRPWWDKGFVAESRKDWLRIAKHLVGNREQTAQAAKDARAYVLAERTIAKNITAWREAICG